jgi:hypothetical protein
VRQIFGSFICFTDCDQSRSADCNQIVPKVWGVAWQKMIRSIFGSCTMHFAQLQALASVLNGSIDFYRPILYRILELFGVHRSPRLVQAACRSPAPRAIACRALHKLARRGRRGSGEGRGTHPSSSFIELAGATRIIIQPMQANF